MALPTAIPPVIPRAQVVANAFISHYFHILHHNPGHVYIFYQDLSVMSRPDSDGVMRSVTTMQTRNSRDVLSHSSDDFSDKAREQLERSTRRLDELKKDVCLLLRTQMLVETATGEDGIDDVGLRDTILTLGNA